MVPGDGIRRYVGRWFPQTCGVSVAGGELSVAIGCIFSRHVKSSVGKSLYIFCYLRDTCSRSPRVTPPINMETQTTFASPCNPVDPNVCNRSACSDLIAAAIERCKIPTNASGGSNEHRCSWTRCKRQKPFSNKSRLLDHVRAVHKPKSFACQCGAAFAHKCELIRHTNRLKAQQKNCAPREHDSCKRIS